MLEVNHLPLPSPATWRPTCPLHSEVLAIFHGAILLQSAHQNVYPNHPREASAKDRTLRFAEVGKGPSTLWVEDNAGDEGLLDPL